MSVFQQGHELMWGRLRQAAARLGFEALDRVQEALSVPGSPAPFVHSAPGEPPTNWETFVLRDAVRLEVLQGPEIGFALVSAGYDPYYRVGEHISLRVEFGGFWSGKAYVPGQGIKQIAPPHRVAPRPFLRPEIDRLTAAGPAALAAHVGG